MENHPFPHNKELTVSIERPTITIEFSGSDYLIMMIQKQSWLQKAQLQWFSKIKKCVVMTYESKIGVLG